MNRETIIEECRQILSVVAERRTLNRPCYLTTVRKTVEEKRLITLRLSEYLAFLDQQRLVVFDKVRNTLELTEAGDHSLSGNWPAGIAEAIGSHFAAAMGGGGGGEPVREAEPEQAPPPAQAPHRAQAEPPPAPGEPSPAAPRTLHAVARPAASAAAESRRPLVAGGWSPPTASAEPETPSPVPASRPQAAPQPAAPAASAPAPAPRPSAVAPAAAPPVKGPASRRYERQESLGSGGIGQVFEGLQCVLERPVAIKEIRNVFNYFPAARRPEIIEQIREVSAQHARLHHPFIVELLDCVLDDEFPYLVMEFCANGSLRDRIKDQGRVEPRLAIQVFVQAAEALAFAHRLGVLHRNLKPENILFDNFGNAKLVDFGMSRIAEREDQKGQLYLGGGTVAYMSPEQFQDASSTSAQSDLYSMGIILYEMLTGKLPGRRSPMPSEHYEDIPRDIDDIFDRMTMDILRDRYTSMDEVLHDLYRSPAILALLRRRGPVLFTDTDLSSLPELPEPTVTLRAPVPPARTATPSPRPSAVPAAAHSVSPQGPAASDGDLDAPPQPASDRKSRRTIPEWMKD